MLYGDPGFDQVENIHKSAVYLWDTSTLGWVKACGSAGVGTAVAVQNWPASQPVSAATLPLPTGAATDAELALLLTELQELTRPTDTQPVSIASAVPVTGTFFQATQPVSGPLTDTQLRATAVPISGTVTASGPLTDGQLRATAVPISGTVNPATSYGKTITYVPVAQSVAGSLELAAASPGNKHKLIGGMLTMSVAGTLKFTDGVGDLTGAMNFAANGGVLVPESPVPLLETAAVNRALNLVTTLGAANGVLAILTEP